ncbi:anhydro-N-acetylmuramic acid kinase [Kineococcus sp. SYSU DK002]|uniref:anhydro-N-acetylmuramic acid kinase n=1 Tax=Kineococcus sp. SYSU DK002 TaxID=3383123 RepID=UPI003D7D4716
MSVRVLGMVSGTSHDGIDLAVVEFTPDGDVLHARLGEHRTVPYSAALRADLVAALPPGRVDLARVCALDVRVGQEFAAAAASVAEGFDAVCSHGQTVFHWVQDGSVRGTLQLGQPAWIAEATGVPVVSDLRTADVAAGGQGAPLVPLLDRLLLAPSTDRGETVAALNLGGIANVTVCAPGAAPRAWDTGPANALVDAVVAADPAHPDAFDRDGRLAAAGRVDDGLLARFLADPYYARPAPKTCGKELFHLGHVTGVLAGRRVATADLVATLTELTARTVAAALAPAGVTRVVASGGGVRNPVLLAAIARHLPGVEVTRSDDLGCPADDKEAVAFALLGWATLHGLPGNVPSCTGADGERVLGRVTPGRRGFPAVPPLPRRPVRLHLG